MKLQSIFRIPLTKFKLISKTTLIFSIFFLVSFEIYPQDIFLLSPYSAKLGTGQGGGFINNVAEDHFSAGGLSYSGGSRYFSEIYEYMSNGIPIIYKLWATRTVPDPNDPRYFGPFGSFINYAKINSHGYDEVADATVDQMNIWISQIEFQIQDAVNNPQLNPNIVAWYLGPEECRWWKAKEVELLSHMYNLVKTIDPNNRPAFMYNPQLATHERLLYLKDYLDFWTLGIYPHIAGNDHQRIQVRHQMEVMKEANRILIVTHNEPPKPIVPVLEMYESTTHPYNTADTTLITEFVRHDAYVAIANGATGILIWSMGNRSGFVNYSRYYRAWSQFSKETNEQGLRKVFLDGIIQNLAYIEVNTGQDSIQFIWNTVNETYPSLSFREWEFNGASYMLVVNSSEDSVGFTIRNINVLSGSIYWDMFNGAQYTITGDTLNMILQARGIAMLTSNAPAGVRQGPPFLPESIHLNQNYPNPFNPITTINYEIITSEQIKLEIYNIRGQHIRTLVDSFQQPGNYEIVWDGKNENGIMATNGIYFYHLKVGKNKTLSKKMIMVK